ncbi:MAG: HAMP domain-containing protein, partial [Geminicoccaceae bacterium]
MSHQQESSIKSPWRLSISAYLGLGLGGLVAVALALLLWVTLDAIFKNTTELLEDKSRLVLSALTTQTSQFLDTALAPSEVIAEQIASGRLDPTDTEGMSTLLRTLLATTPAIEAIAFFDVDGTRVAAFHTQRGIDSDRRPWPDMVEIKDALDAVRGNQEAVWGPPVYSPDLGTFLNVSLPVFKGETYKGMAAALVTVRELSDFLAELETESGQNSFILYNRDYVLAHFSLAGGFAGLHEGRPLPKVTEIGDPVLFSIWQRGWRDNALIAGSGHFGQIGDRDYIFLYSPLDDYADAPWLVGSYFSSDDIATQVERMVATAVGSLLLVVLTVIGTYLLGRFLRRPINELAEAATAIQELDLDAVPHLRPSRFAELDDASQAFNAMASALRAFSQYVPRDLVRRLIARGDINELRSEARTITVLMTDIVGFSGRAERLSVVETAGFLNRHLGLVTSAIEAEDGIVDKFIGDAVMAFWGAIEDEPDHASRAVAAANRIRQAVREDNAMRDDPV